MASPQAATDATNVRPGSRPEELRLSISSPLHAPTADMERTFRIDRLVPEPAVECAKVRCRSGGRPEGLHSRWQAPTGLASRIIASTVAAALLAPLHRSGQLRTAINANCAAHRATRKKRSLPHAPA
jgi:hypothetical protein